MRKLLYIIPLFIFAFTFTGNPPSGGWYQQFLPDVGGMPISDMEFLDSLTGFFVTDNDSGPDTGYIAKTTDGGDNWSIVFKDRRDFSRIIFLNNSTGYVCGGTGTGTPYIYKTTNQGDNWFVVPSPDQTYWEDISVLNEDTIWVVDKSSFNGGVFRTTNGGLNWTNQYFNVSSNPDKIYMINGRIGFMGALFKTTNSGLNWFQVDVQSMGNMYFKDTLTGWRANGSMKKTTNGGINWVTQTLPSGGIISVSSISDLSVISDDTIWGVGARTSNRGLIYKTTNGGLNWGYQLPDTSINIFRYSFVDFTSATHGWAYSVLQGGVHTIVGGDDTTIYLGITQISSQIPDNFTLFQNYPNPFNPTTSINYELKIKSEVQLTVYDISGKTIGVLVDQEQAPGTYQYKFDGSKLSSGIYFYKLKTDNFTDTKKMMLIK